MDALATDVVLFSVAGAADIASTHYALSRCPSCGEGNPFMREPAVALVSRAAVIGLNAYACEELRKSGHRNRARVLRWVVVGLWLGFAVRNIRVAG